eukprot:GHVS01011820.1.p1 GENE.GHVS01011820.1~~GHVS01011820.1.p1  ORF type:complete len:717 (-),score=188.25 GHVS01011820.1:335-2485(-)
MSSSSCRVVAPLSTLLLVVCLLYTFCLLAVSPPPLPPPHNVVRISLEGFNLPPIPSGAAPLSPPTLVKHQSLYLPQCDDPVTATFFPYLFNLLHTIRTTTTTSNLRPFQTKLKNTKSLLPSIISPASRSAGGDDPPPSSSSLFSSFLSSLADVTSVFPVLEDNFLLSHTPTDDNNLTTTVRTRRHSLSPSLSPSSPSSLSLSPSSPFPSSSVSLSPPPSSEVTSPSRRLIELNWTLYAACMATAMLAEHSTGGGSSLGHLLCTCAEKLTLNNPTLLLAHVRSQCSVTNAILTGPGCSSGANCAVTFSQLLPDNLFEPALLELPLQNRLLLPAPPPPSVVTVEGPTYHTLWQAVRTVYDMHSVATCGGQVCPTCSQQSFDYILPGWKTQRIIDVVPEVAPLTDARPLLVIGRRNRSILLVLRGARHVVDWIHIVKYNLVTSSTHTTTTTTGNTLTTTSTKWTWPAPGVSEGLARIAAAILKPLLDYIATFSGAVGGADISDVMVTGHSLGSGVGALITYQIALFLKCIQSFPSSTCYPPTTTATTTGTTTDTTTTASHLYDPPSLTPSSSPPPISAVLFACPKVGSSSFSLLLAGLANFRCVNFVLDSISSVPCNNTPGCTYSMAIVPTAESGKKQTEMFHFDKLPGTVEITVADLPPTSLWRANLFPQFATGANHWCAFSCFLATKFSPQDYRTECDANNTTMAAGQIAPPNICLM